MVNARVLEGSEVRFRNGDGCNRLWAGTVLGAALLLSACQTAAPSPVATGAAGYDTLSAALEQEPVAALYTLQPGDVVSVTVFGEPELSAADLTLDNTGAVDLPLIGSVAARGQSAASLAQMIEQAYGARYLRDPRVTVAIRQSRALSVTVEGEVEQPGRFPYTPGQTLLTALAEARSPTDAAALGDVIVFRNTAEGRLGGRFDVRAIRAGRMPDLDLMPGDIIVVGRSARRAAWQNFLRSTPLLGVLTPL